MNNTLVIHINGGVTDIVNNPEESPVVVINFNNYATLPNMGMDNEKIRCPKCQHNGSQIDWNTATCDDVSGDHYTVFTRIQDAESESQFTCAYCYETSTTEELGLKPVEPLDNAHATDENSDDLKCPKCLSHAENIGSGFIESGEWNGKNYEMEKSVDQYRCGNTECGKEFFL
ncbi:hypothetical protein [Paenibacillus gallinarum]|uniref:Uncharacterized protein n=1 Tax=Paenibacillus gallinarum TaxID=2762232 RepID=A0ABR8T3J8_9BACL|nr:hypothetical protein [Paenibacillus gallinarum]MBD7970328.1 hypothetical protein [Paenibacillus gallinarum]